MKLQRLLIRFMLTALVVGSIFIFLRIPVFLSSFYSDKSINVLVLPNIFDTSYIKEFEKESGIKVYITYFDTYEELMVKMRSGSGDYDLIMGVDYLVESLKEEDLIKPLDKSKIDFADRLYPAVKNLYCDPGMVYAIPFAWQIYGIGIDTLAFGGKLPKASWALIFDKKYASYRVGMIDYAREAVTLAAFYLFGKKRELSIHDLELVKELLLKQKKTVTLYTDFREDYLLISKTCGIVVGLSNDINRAVMESKTIQFIVPEEGSFIGFDMFSIPIDSYKDDMTYSFLNYLYRKQVYKNYLERFHFMPVLIGVVPRRDLFYIEPTERFMRKANYFNYIIPEKELHKLWITLKS